ncbi:nucleoside deaminase [Nafulsella turpanensis]|uniref:nucleoside deaminase n=1 Tax=Nafulsella turpanensis TaxID=1265690 RepID=UPI000349EFE4|nr:nucleoside deaminase [Nafulsella turpanensis]
MLSVYTDEHFMREALRQAQQAFEEGEVPVGAVVVSNNKVIARAYNQTERLNDVTAHAEMLALTAAANYLGGKYLSDCTLYITLEPCNMCAGALYWGQLKKLVIGASDEQRGYSRMTPSLLHPKTEVVSGLLEAECKALVDDFFRQLRKKR